QKWKGWYPNLNQGIAGRQKLTLAIVLLERRHVPLVPQPKFKGEVRSGLKTIHGKKVESTLDDVRTYVESVRECERIAVDEIGWVVELDQANVMAKSSVVVYLPAFPTKFEAMFRVKVAHSVA